MNKSSYKIVICTPAVYSAGGVERVVAVKASYFADQLDYDVTIIVIRFGLSIMNYTLRNCGDCLSSRK